MTNADAKQLLVVRHVPWEHPHRILKAFDGFPLRTVDVFEPGARLPGHDEVVGAVFMGGPMSVNDTKEFPALTTEINWLQEALADDMPILGICLGSQLLAHALGARVLPGSQMELGWAPIEVLEPSDELLAPLAPRTTVLHWHRDLFELPLGFTVLARSDQTEIQAFRAGSNAWGMLFHPEADQTLVEQWLSEPTMTAQARATLGPDYLQTLQRGARCALDRLLPASTALFDAFALRCGRR